MTRFSAIHLSLCAGLAFTIAACDGGGGSSKQVYDDEGRERIPILSATTRVEADRSLANTTIRLPAPYINKNWAQSGGNARHVPQHVAMGASLTLAWRGKFGEGSRDYERIITGPVSGGGKVFVADVTGAVSALSLYNGTLLWRNPLDNNGERTEVGYGGGVAYRDGVVYATSGYGYVVALDAATGTERWRRTGVVPMRGAPTVTDQYVFAISQDNQILAMDRASGTDIWDQVGIAETAGVLGAASPAFDGETVVAGLSSGELMAMRGSNGRIVWQDSVSSGRQLTPLSTLTDIDGNPVINEGRVMAVSHGGRMIAVDMRSGERAWESDISGVTTPWIAGDYGFISTVDAQIVCFQLSDGRIRWVEQLQRFVDQKKRRGLINWYGPLLAGDRLIVTSSHGYAVTLSPYTGEVISGVKMPDGSSVQPIVVDQTLLVLLNNGEMIAYR